MKAFSGDEVYWVAETLAGVTFDPSLEYELAWRMMPTRERKRFRVITSLATDHNDSLMLGYPIFFSVDPAGQHARWLSSVLHVLALRGNPERRYQELSVAEEEDIIRVEGPFPPYTASVLVRWQEHEATGRLGMVRHALKGLGLTWTVKARRVSSVEVALKVGRRRARGSRGGDLVDIADTGFGISQVIPLLVALAAARPGQMVYVEQPELHLHPRAQWRLGKLLAESAAKGVLVVVETHSSLLLRGIQEEVASGGLTPEAVGLHWFQQDSDTGITRVTLAELDARGAFGDWPVDFSEVEMEADKAWLDAAFGEDGQ